MDDETGLVGLRVQLNDTQEKKWEKIKKIFLMPYCVISEEERV